VVVSDVCGKKAGAYLATSLLCRKLARLNLNVICFSTWVEHNELSSTEVFKIVEPRIKKGYRWDLPNRCLALQAARYIEKWEPALVFVVGLTRLSRYLIRSSVASRLLLWELTNANPGNKFVDSEASRLLSRCRALLSPSATIDRNIRKTYNYQGHIERLPFWIEDDKLPLAPPPSKFLTDFIFLGRRDEEKGLRELIQATAILTKEYPKVKVLIGGSGSEISYVSLVRSLGIEENVAFRYLPSRQETMEALAKSRSLVLPSYHEGYPLVLLEAAKYSVPYIATRVGSIPEVFSEDKACILVKPKDTMGLAAAMRNLLSESQDEYKGRRSAAHNKFNKISSSACVSENLNRLIREYAPELFSSEKLTQTN